MEHSTLFWQDTSMERRDQDGSRLTNHGLSLGFQMSLANSKIWSTFNNEGIIEMIITKQGRRMFPCLTVEMSGLDPKAHYTVMLDMVLASRHRYKFSASQWVAAGRMDSQYPPWRVYVHPDSPATGEHWMSRPVNLQRAKLTNNPLDNHGHIVLMSMHKYIPRVLVLRSSDDIANPYQCSAAVSFSEAEFIAVTAYQNVKMTRLKIDNNPFAKGFRKGGLSKHKSKSPTKEDNEKVIPRKRSCSEPSSDSSLGESSRSSLCSCSPASTTAETDSAESRLIAPPIPRPIPPFSYISWGDLFSPTLRPYLHQPTYPSYSLPFKSDSYMSDIHPLWRYPYLIPQPVVHPQSLLPPPPPPPDHRYSLPLPATASLEPYLIDLSLRERRYCSS